MHQLIKDVEACKACAQHLPLWPRPVINVSRKSKIILIWQAPWTKVHASWKPRDDASWENLRNRLQVSEDEFYDPDLFGIMPMWFCYPWKSAWGDSPPRPECAPLWHKKLLKYMKDHQLILLIWSYAQKYYLGKDMKKTLTETVQCFEEYMPKYLPLPHPSWRSKIRQKKNPWFEKKVLPILREKIRTVAIT